MNDYIRICEVEKYYGNAANVTKAVDRVSFTVEKGEFVGAYGTVFVYAADYGGMFL